MICKLLLYNKNAIIIIFGFICFTFCSFTRQDTENYALTSPFEKADFENTATSYRSIGKGVSSNANVAKEKAVLDAKARLAKAIIKSYGKCKPHAAISEVTLTNTKEIKEETETGDDDSNICWVIIEADKSGIWSTIFPKDANNQVLIKKFEKEMKSLKTTVY